MLARCFLEARSASFASRPTLPSDLSPSDMLASALFFLIKGDALHTLAMLSGNGHCMLSDVSASFSLTACTIMHSVSFLTLMSPLNAGGFQSYTENCDSFVWWIEFFPFDL
jgi:hypothetical protein